MLLFVRVHKLVLEGNMRVLDHRLMQFYVFSCVYTDLLTSYTPLLGFEKFLCNLRQGRHSSRELLEEIVKTMGDKRKQNC